MNRYRKIVDGARFIGRRVKVLGRSYNWRHGEMLSCLVYLDNGRTEVHSFNANQTKPIKILNVDKQPKVKPSYW